MGATLSPLQPQEYPENVRVEFGLEGAELEEVLEQPLEEVLGELLGWKECMCKILYILLFKDIYAMHIYLYYRYYIYILYILLNEWI